MLGSLALCLNSQKLVISSSGKRNSLSAKYGKHILAARTPKQVVIKKTYFRQLKFEIIVILAVNGESSCEIFLKNITFYSCKYCFKIVFTAVLCPILVFLFLSLLFVLVFVLYLFCLCPSFFFPFLRCDLVFVALLLCHHSPTFFLFFFIFIFFSSVLMNLPT